MKIQKIIIVCAIMLLPLSGCKKYADSGTYIPSPLDVKRMTIGNKNVNVVGKAEDKQLAKAFETDDIDSVTYMAHSADGIMFEKKRILDVDSRIRLSSSRNVYRRMAPGFAKDDIVTKYKEVAEERGNEVVSYKGIVNKSILEARVGGKLKAQSQYEIFMYDSDFAFIEVDSSGNFISALTRQARLAPSQLAISSGDRDPYVTINQQTFILYKSQMEVAELSLSNSLLAENEIGGNRNRSAKSSPSNNVATKSKAAQIKELFELHQSGAISKEEFQHEKSNILKGESSIAESNKTSNLKDEIDLSDEQQVQNFKSSNGTSFSSLRESMEKQALDKLNKQNGTNFTSLQEAMGNQ